MYCPRCGSRMHSKGFYTRKLNHPVLQDSTKFYMIVKQRKWHCDECNLYMNDSFPFLDRYAHSTTITPLLILNEFKHLDQRTAAIAERFNISDTRVFNTSQNYRFSYQPIKWAFSFTFLVKFLDFLYRIFSYGMV